MFPYFGRKDRLRRYFPPPRYPLVVEPFAGSMSWTLAHRPTAALGIEADPRVVELWHRICDDPAAFASQPPPVVGEVTDDLFVKLCSYSEHSLTSGPMSVSARMIRDWPHVTQRAAQIAEWARRTVDYRHGHYADAPDVEATWFIDPPYQHANRRGYRMRTVDFGELGEWVRTRRGQVIVCEQRGADWLPFSDLSAVVSHGGGRRPEVIWTNEPFDLLTPAAP